MFFKYIIIVLSITTSLVALEIEIPKSPVIEAPIIEAIKAGEYNRFQELFDKSAMLKRYGQNQTLLHYATRYNRKNVAELLVQQGALIDAVGGEYNETPLHTSIRYGYLNLAVYLIKYHANVNLKDKDGETPLDIATRLGYSNIVELLKQYGAISNGTNNQEEMNRMDREVNSYKDGTRVNQYKNGDSVNMYHPKINASQVELRHIQIESDNNEKNNKDMGIKNSEVDIGN